MPFLVRRGVGQSGFRFYCGRSERYADQPNDLNSVIPFRLDAAAAANAHFAPGLSVLPVKNRPKGRLRAGVFTRRLSMRYGE